MTKVKICGITNLEDALLSAKFGADALGFNFYAKSPRYIAPEKAREIIEQLPAKVLKVGVFVNESLEKIVEIAAIAKLDALQLHGEETPEFARELKAKTNLEIIKAFRVSSEFKPEDVLKYEVDAILLDAYNPQEHGGTGETFDWEIAFKVKQIVSKLYIAGGLDSSNVDIAIRKVQPFAVDSCSRLEWELGKKEKRKVYSFISNAKKRNKFEGNNPFRSKNIYDFLLAIELYPSMFLGKNSISLLSTFLNGIEFGLKEFCQSTSNFDWKEFKSNKEPHYEFGFQKWISERYKNRRGYNQTWSDSILYQVDGDEEKAFDLFFALLEEFKLEKEDLGEN